VGAPPRRIFISYAHSDNTSTDPDRRWLDRLLEMAAPLHMSNAFDLWTDKRLTAGVDWKNALDQELQAASAAVVLVSPAYLASQFICENELPLLLWRALQKHQDLVVLPVILRHCLFEEIRFQYKDADSKHCDVAFSSFQGINSPREPLESMTRSMQDLVLLNLAKQMHAAIVPKPPAPR